MADVKTATGVEAKVTDSRPPVEKYKNLLLGVLGVLTLGIAGYFYYDYTLEESNKEAQNEIYPAVYFFEQDSLDKALKGDGKVLGLLDIAEKYSGTKTGKLANFYTGVIYLKQAKYEEAINHLSEFSSNDYLLQARAYALTGDAYMEMEKYDDAVSFYKKAADYKANEQFTPSYLMKLALAYETLKDNKNASDTYDVILTKYPKSQEINDAKKYKARVDALATE
ncbi:MAG TPA: tetratricopeptide repeat protein [Cytophagaceae bacterium]|jgi:tetratricopeptide (TPR) repeat protein|nr:tetratricopeptide repeat protein [Cytophagaceae bacterium]